MAIIRTARHMLIDTASLKLI